MIPRVASPSGRPEAGPAGARRIVVLAALSIFFALPELGADPAGEGGGWKSWFPWSPASTAVPERPVTNPASGRKFLESRLLHGKDPERGLFDRAARQVKAGYERLQSAAERINETAAADARERFLGTKPDARRPLGALRGSRTYAEGVVWDRQRGRTRMLQETASGGYRTLNGGLVPTTFEITQYRNYVEETRRENERAGRARDVLENTPIELWRAQATASREDGYRTIRTPESTYQVRLYVDDEGKTRAVHVGGERNGEAIPQRELDRWMAGAHISTDVDLASARGAASAVVDHQGATASVSGSLGYNAVRVELSSGRGQQQLGGAVVSAEASAGVQAGAEVHGRASLTARGDELGAEAAAGGVAGVTAELRGTGAVDLNDLFGLQVTVNAGLQGTLGAQGQVSGHAAFNWRTGRVRLSGQAAAALGLGGGGNATVEVDAGEFVRVVRSEAGLDGVDGQADLGDSVRWVRRLVRRGQFEFGAGQSGASAIRAIGELGRGYTRSERSPDLLLALLEQGIIRKPERLAGAGAGAGAGAAAGPGGPDRPDPGQAPGREGASPSGNPPGARSLRDDPTALASGPGAAAAGEGGGEGERGGERLDELGRRFGADPGGARGGESEPGDRGGNDSGGGGGAAIPDFYFTDVALRRDRQEAGRRRLQAERAREEALARQREREEHLNLLQSQGEELSRQDRARLEEIRRAVAQGRAELEALEERIRREGQAASEFDRQIDELEREHREELARIRAEGERGGEAPDGSDAPQDPAHQGLPIDPQARGRVEEILRAGPPEPGGGPNGEDDDGNGFIDEGYNDPRYGNVRLVITDNGFIEDDGFILEVNGNRSPAMPIGKTLLWPVTLAPGPHTLTVTCIEAPDNEGTFYVYGVGDLALSHSAVIAQGKTVSVPLSVGSGSPGSPSRAPRATTR